MSVLYDCTPYVVLGKRNLVVLGLKTIDGLQKYFTIVLLPKQVQLLILSLKTPETLTDIRIVLKSSPTVFPGVD